MNTTIVLAANPGVVCEELRLLVESEPGFVVVACALGAVDAIRHVENISPDIAILDTSISDTNVTAASEQIVKRSPETRIIILSTYGDCMHVYQALFSGAQGYVLRESVAKDLPIAVDTVMANHRYLSQRLTDMLVNDYIAQSGGERDQAVRPAQLSPRELEVLRLVAEGRSSANIAQQLGLAISTIDSYRSRMMQKLEITSSAALVKYAVRNGLIDR